MTGRSGSTPNMTEEEASSSAENTDRREWNIGERILNLYSVKEIYRSGGMGFVYRVHHAGWNVDLAVKSPRWELTQAVKTEEHFRSFESECQKWVSLGLHPNVVSCYYVRRIGGVPSAFAEFMDGGSLSEWIKTGKLYEGGAEQSLQRIVGLAIQSAWGLQYSHDKGLVHQDIKPANIMMTHAGVARITDFGGAKTDCYCSPEQASDEAPSAKTDTWSWGVCVLEMFRGERTWLSGLAAPSVLRNLAAATPSHRRPRMPTSLAELLRHCFQVDPADRPGDAEILKCLYEVHQQITGRPHPSKPPKAAEGLADSLNNWALSHLDLSDYRESERCWLNALAIDPHHPEATYNYGVFRWRRGNVTDKALVRQLEDVRTSHRDSWRSRRVLILAHIERGDTDAATKLLSQPIAHSSDSSEQQVTMALAGSDTVPMGRLEKCISGHKGAVEAICVTPDGRRAWSGSADSTLRLWDINTEECIEVVDAGTRVNAMCLSDDARRLLWAGEDGGLRLRDVVTGETRILGSHAGKVHSMSASPDFRFAVSGGEDKTVRLWSLTTAPTRSFSHNDAVTAVAISPDGSSFLSAVGIMDNSLIRLWDVTTGRSIREFRGHTKWINSLGFSPDGKYIVSGGGDVVAITEEVVIRLWETDSGKCIREFKLPGALVTSVVVSPDGKYVLSGSEYDHSLRLWELGTSKCARTFEGHESAVKAVAFTPDGQFLLSGGSDMTIRVWYARYREDGQERPHPQFPPLLCKPLDTEALGTEQEAVETLIAEADACLADKRFSEAYTKLRNAQSHAGFERDQRILDRILRCAREKARW
jgi:WD40 repeat protein